jgi:hypothetical protein
MIAGTAAVMLIVNLMRTVSFLPLIFGIAMLGSSCSKNTPQPSSVVTLAANEKGSPQIDYAGPGAMNYHYTFESFTFQIGPAYGGAPWTTGKGAMKFSDSNHVTLDIQSSSDRAYDIELLGVWTNRNLAIPENVAKEKLHMAAGDQKLSLERFVIWTYDFSKEK